MSFAIRVELDVEREGSENAAQAGKREQRNEFEWARG